MSIENAVARRDALLTTLGKQGLNIKHPDEFELYIIALESVDHLGNTLQYFIFPVMPSSMDYNNTEIKSIKKTQNGISVLRSTSFVPNDYTLSGSFGRRFRVLLGQDYQDLASSFKSISNINQSKFQNQVEGIKKGLISFDDRVKTGYGCCKILEDIVASTNSIESGIKTLILHNPALGHSHIIEPISLRFSMSQDSNMIWNYTFQMKSVGPVSSLRVKRGKDSEEKQLVGTNYAQQRVNSLVSFLTSTGSVKNRLGSS